MTHKHFSGLTLITLGALALLQSLGTYYFGLTFWPAVLVWLGLEMVWGSLFDHWHGPQLFGAALGFFVAGLGLIKILQNAGMDIAMTYGDMLRMGWPVLLVGLGLSLMFRRSRVTVR